MSFITDAQLATQVEGVLKVPAGTLTATVPAWTPVLAQANATAFNSIQTVLLERGFSTTAINAWDNGVTYQEAIGVYFALVFGSGLHGYDDRFIEKYKWYFDDLPDVLIVRGGTIT